MHYPTTIDKVTRYMVYNTKTGKYTGPFIVEDQPMKVKKPKLKAPKTKPVNKAAKGAKDVKKPKKAAKSAINPIVAELVKARNAAGISIVDVAKAMKRHPSQVHNFERKTPNPTFGVIQSYAKAIGYSVEMVLKPLKG